METHQETPAARARQYLMLRIARQDFAMDAMALRGILPGHELELVSPSPGLTQYFGPHTCGFANLRGRDIPVVDLRVKLQLPHATRGRHSCVVVVEIPGPDGPRLAGFVADKVSDIVAARPRDFVDGKLRLAGRPRKVLEVDSLLSA